MYASVTSASFDLPVSEHEAVSHADSWTGGHCGQRDPLVFIALVRAHHRSIFHLIHALLRDEVTAERITQRVFSRARRRLERNAGDANIVEWIYHAGFRYARMYHWRSARTLTRRRLASGCLVAQPGLDLDVFVQVIARHPGKIDPRDCELLALRHVLGMSLTKIAQLLRMHPYQVADRLAWAHERVCKLSQRPVIEAASERPPVHADALSA